MGGVRSGPLHDVSGSVEQSSVGTVRSGPVEELSVGAATSGFPVYSGVSAGDASLQQQPAEQPFTADDQLQLEEQLRNIQPLTE